jgi:hypothetical protein
MIGESKLGGPEQPSAMELEAEAEAEAERAHAARVEAHQASTGWGPESALRLAALTSRIAKLQRQSSVSRVEAVVAVLVGVADLGLAGFALTGALAGAGGMADEAVLTLLALFVPTVWAAWTLTSVVQRRREHVYRAERDRLLRDRGCGDPACPRCD